MRLRQVALASRRLDEGVRALGQAFGLKVGHVDPEIDYFGLRNVVMPTGTGFLEIVEPIAADASAARFLDRRGGEAGYMIILQVADAAAERDRIAAQGVRVVEELPRPTYHSVHFHPADFGGVLASVDQQISEPDLLAPYGDWLPAGDDWRMAMTPDVLDLAAVTISTPDPVALAGSWSRLLDRPQVGLRLALDQGEIRFALGQTTAITGIDLKVADRTRAGEPAVNIGGVAFSPV